MYTRHGNAVHTALTTCLIPPGSSLGKASASTSFRVRDMPFAASSSFSSSRVSAKFAFPSWKSGSARPRPACPCMRDCCSHPVAHIHTHNFDYHLHWPDGLWVVCRGERSLDGPYFLLWCCLFWMLTGFDNSHHVLCGQLPSICRRGFGHTQLLEEHSTRSCLQSLCDPLAPWRWSQDGLYLDWHYPASLDAFHNSYVHIWKESSHVDGSSQLDGEVLIVHCHCIVPTHHEHFQEGVLLLLWSIRSSYRSFGIRYYLHPTGQHASATACLICI
jgi:hypothetical protein